MVKNFGAPIDGRLIELIHVPDAVFAGKIIQKNPYKPSSAG